LDSKSSSPSADSNLRGAVIYDLTKNVMMGTKYKSHTGLALRIAHEMLGNITEATDASVVIERRNLFIAGDVHSVVVDVSCSREEFEKKG
jgi:dihydroneopterin aldolase